ncbi:MAG TPA: hypothetical protein VFZ77_16230 [Acidimicrobiales bacterium]
MTSGALQALDAAGLAGASRLHEVIDDPDISPYRWRWWSAFRRPAWKRAPCVAAAALTQDALGRAFFVDG